MEDDMKSLPLALLCIGTGLQAASPAPREASTPPDTYTVVCTFTNPAYSGLCSVSEATPRSVPAQAACRGVLSCLNSDRCVTKTYCNATTVRGGWRLVTAKGAPRGSRTPASPAPGRER
jgi:hypothetical protein